ncbi:hypothetical protein SQ11_12370 [Nitrosospira sp. NpAV]|nr:hypothetical protein SQ11_12370 [Nitrosospira sp. NpAV]
MAGHAVAPTERILQQRYLIHRANDEFPAYRAEFKGMPVLILHGKHPFICDDYFMAATRAPVNPRMYHGSAGRIFFIELDMLGLNEKTRILIVRHDRLKSWLTSL